MVVTLKVLLPCMFLLSTPLQTWSKPSALQLQLFYYIHTNVEQFSQTEDLPN
jgi:hypothetical protein